jgi:Zn-dependent protease
LDDLQYQAAVLAVTWYAVFVFSTTLHEAGHAWAALRLGDATAYWGGQVTLNPGPHLAREPLGMIVAPIVSYLMWGWMIGWASAPYNMGWALRYPRRAALMAMAGPGANLLLAVVTGGMMWVGLRSGFFVGPAGGGGRLTDIVSAPQEGLAAPLAMLLSIAFMLNLIMFVFNLIPFPPLDGSAALPLLLPRRLWQAYFGFMEQPMFAFLGLFIAWQVFGEVFPFFRNIALRLLYA